MDSGGKSKPVVVLNRPEPRRIGKYVVARELGRGSTSTVYLCHDAYRGRDVAVKLYHSDQDLSPEEAEVRRRLFFNEAQMAGMLDHPNILPILDAGELDDARYIVMEFIPGARPLSDYTEAEHLLPVNKCVEVAFKCARALAYAHRQGVIHRDIKPGNILLTESGDVRLVDFGVARTAIGGLDKVRGLIGSPSYMAPEQLGKHIATRETDLYALGVVLYELLTGKRPFYGDSLERLKQQVMYASPVPVHRLRDDVPPELERIVNRALEKQPARRYRSALDFAADLSQAFQRAARLRQQTVEQERFSQLRHLDFFRDFAYPDIWELLNAGSWETYREGEALVREGDLDESFFILVSGRVNIQRGQTVVGKLREGSCFGEAGYLEGQQRDSSIVADEEVQALRLTATAIERCSTACQLRFMRQFLRMILTRLSS